jgi:hypothetical protein
MSTIRVAARKPVDVDSSQRYRIHSHAHAAMKRNTVLAANAPRSARRSAWLRVGAMRGRGSTGIDRALSRIVQ